MENVQHKLERDMMEGYHNGGHVLTNIWRSQYSRLFTNAL